MGQSNNTWGGKNNSWGNRNRGSGSSGGSGGGSSGRSGGGSSGGSGGNGGKKMGVGQMMIIGATVMAIGSGGTNFFTDTLGNVGEGFDLMKDAKELTQPKESTNGNTNSSKTVDLQTLTERLSERARKYMMELEFIDRQEMVMLILDVEEAVDLGVVVYTNYDNFMDPSYYSACITNEAKKYNETVTFIGYKDNIGDLAEIQSQYGYIGYLTEQNLEDGFEQFDSARTNYVVYGEDSNPSVAVAITFY